MKFSEPSLWNQDWRRAAEYAYPDDLPAAGWGWEFLRRNAEYREQWVRCVRNFDDRAVADGEDESAARLIASGKLGSPRAGDEWVALLGPTEVDPQTWGLEAWTNPRVLAGGWYWDSVYPLRRGQLWYAIDPRQPLEPQLDSIRQDMAIWTPKAKPKRPRIHRDEWTLYLRALDGRDAGASREEIRDRLHANAAFETLDRQLSRAVDMCRSGFRPLLAYPLYTFGSRPDSPDAKSGA